ncbi:hypothetical protein [Kitasatospora sp. NPDC086791]|uniref:hypothetical protein n=1 Tax=Kitasatospora sp. NPDC086791 TaxID=3155178 RepID=UPI00344475E4
MPKTIDLYFDLSSVRLHAEHAAAADRHAVYDGTPPVPALAWCKSEGTFIKSNGRPFPDLPDVFAHGWGPGRDRLLSKTPVGGDDFVHMIPLHDTYPLSDGSAPTLLEWIRRSDKDGVNWFVLTVDGGGFGIAMDSRTLIP